MMSSDYIYELLDLLSKDNLQATINSNEAAEKLCLSLSWMLREIDEDSSLIPSFLSKGILCLIKFFQHFFSQLSATCEYNPNIFSSFENILEILNNVADTGIQTRCTVVLQFAEDLISHISNQLLPFPFRLKIVKYTNLLFERCPTYVKDCLYAKPTYKKHLKNTLKLISSVGDYEFQVGIIECVFRTVSKQRRNEALNTLCSPDILSSILAIKDENFEADCRRVLNAFNSQQGAQQRVFSIPCLEVTLGNLQLHKPKDENYKEFWIDFNTSSKRISFYCCQIIDNEDPQETDEDIWETICILKDYVQEISSNDDDEVFSVQFTFLPLPIELIPGFPLEKFSFIKMLFKDKDAVMKAVQEIFCGQKCSVAKNQICIKENEKPISLSPKMLSPFIHEKDPEIASAPYSVCSSGNVPLSARKSSVPSEIMSSQHSTDGRYCKVGAIRICFPLPSPDPLKKSGPSRMSRPKASNKIVKQKQEKSNQNPPKNKGEQKLEPVPSPLTITADQTHNQFKAAKNKNSDLKTSKIGGKQVFQMKKQADSKSSQSDRKKSVFVFSSADEEEDEVIPPTLESKSLPKESILSKSINITSSHASKTSSYKQNKNQPTSKNSDNLYSSITTRTRSNQAKSGEQFPVAKKQTEIVEENLKGKGESKLLQNPKISPSEKKEKSFDRTQSEKVITDAKPDDFEKQPEDLDPSPKQNTNSYNECSVTDKESTKAQKSFASDSVSPKKSKSDGDLSSKRNSTESNTTTGSRKGRRLRSFEKLDLLPQNYPLPKDGKASKGTSRKKSPFTKKNPSPLNKTAKQLEEDKVTNIKETQPETAKTDDVTLIPESLPLQNDMNKPEKDNAKPKQINPPKSLSKKKLLVDSGISSSNNSPACMKDLPSTASKKRLSLPPLQNPSNLSSKKQTIPQSSPDEKPLPNPQSSNDGKNNENRKAAKTVDPKQHKDNNQNPSNKSISKEKEESCYQFPSHEDSLLETISQAPSYIPITEDNLSKFNKNSQETSAKELDERIEEFVIASCQNLSEGSNTSPFGVCTQDEDKKIESVILKRNSQESSPDTIFGETNENENVQCLAEDDPLPSKSLSEANSKSPPAVTNIKQQQQLKDESRGISPMKVKAPSEQKENDNEVVYQAIKLGPVSALSKNPTVSTTKQAESNHQEQPGNLTVPSKEKDKVSDSSKKYKPLTNRSKSLDSAKPPFGGKENKNPSKIFSSPTGKLFKASPPKRRGLNLSSKRDEAAARVYENKKGYDPYDFDSGSSVEGSVRSAAPCRRFSMTSLLTPQKQQNAVPSKNQINFTSQLQTSKGKKTVPAKHPKATKEDKFGKEKETTQEDSYKFGKEKKTTQEDSYRFGKVKKTTQEDSYKFGKVKETTQEDSYRFGKVKKTTQEDSYKFGKVKETTQEDSYKFGKEKKTTQEDSYRFRKEKETTPEDSYKFENESEGSSAQNIEPSPTCISDSDNDNPQPQKRTKARMTKSKVTENTLLPPLDIPKINPTRSSVRKRKEINYKEPSSSICSSTISSISGPIHGRKRKKLSSDKQDQNFLHKNTVTFSLDREDQMEVNGKISDVADSPYDTSHSRQSEISWIIQKKSPKIQVEKTYAVKKKPSYYGSYACIPKRKNNDSPKGKKRKKIKETKDPVTQEQSPRVSSHNSSPKLNGKTVSVFSPKSFDRNSPQHSKNNHKPSHDKASHKFSPSSDLKMNKKSKQKKKGIKEAIFHDSIEIQRADSFVMFPEDSRRSFDTSATEFILPENTSHPASSISNKSIPELEISLSSTEEPKLDQPPSAANTSILSLNDESIISHASKLMLTPSLSFNLDDLKSISDKTDKDINDQSNAQSGKAQGNASFKCISLKDLSHSTPMNELDIELSPLVYAGGDYNSKTNFRKSLFSAQKSDNSDESKKSSSPSPIGANTFLFPGSSFKKVGYSSKVNFCPTPLSISDKYGDMDSNDESSSDSSHEESSRNDIKSIESDNFLLQSAKLSHHQTSLSVTHEDDDIRSMVESFTEEMKKSILTKKKGVSAVVEEVLKGTQKALNKICEQDVLKRSDVHCQFDKKIQLVTNELQASTELYEEHKKKLLYDFQEQMKDIQKLKNEQQKSLGKLKMINSLYHQTLTSEGNSSKTQHQVQNVMKSQMHRLQSKLLDQARQQEMQQVKNQLRKMLL